ncbi:MAG: hypothetical protein NT065_03025 [Chlamydiae bacterium]|nr:hypothetical protein [Chlamydiota bacterium]
MKHLNSTRQGYFMYERHVKKRGEMQFRQGSKHPIVCLQIPWMSRTHVTTSR